MLFILLCIRVYSTVSRCDNSKWEYKSGGQEYGGVSTDCGDHVDYIFDMLEIVTDLFCYTKDITAYVMKNLIY